MTITQQELGRRLRAARDANLMSQQDVAGHLDTSRSTVAQIELGNRSVSSLELDRLAYLFGRNVGGFLAENFREEDALVALFRAEPAVAEDEELVSVLRECMRLGRELTNLENLLGIDSAAGAVAIYPMRLPKTKWEAIGQGERTATEELRRLGLGPGPIENVAEIMESQGIRTAWLELPDDVSGMTLRESDDDLLVVVNSRHHVNRRRFSYAHEYAHALLDRDGLGTVTTAAGRKDLREVRANAFAASFLLPGPGVERFIEGLGKGKPSRLRAQVFDDAEPVSVEGRSEPGSQQIQLYDVLLLAHHFGVSRQSALYRLRNLKLISKPGFEQLYEREKAGLGREMAETLGLDERDHQGARYEFLHRFIGLALEAYRREKITHSKYLELVQLAGLSEDRAVQLLDDAGLGEVEGPVGLALAEG